ncbi:MAG: redoxin domain-containing protein [Rubrivivax sp.]
MDELIETPPALQVSEWLNTPKPIHLESLRGRVIVVHAFQMLCPACVSLSLPQALRVHESFDAQDVAVLGLHTVFEHHAVMTADALRVFAHEYRLRFPIGIDEASSQDPLPLTMRAYGLRGTPSLLLFDRQGRLRLNHFGHLDDLRVGALIGQLQAEGPIGDRGPHAAL